MPRDILANVIDPIVVADLLATTAGQTVTAQTAARGMDYRRNRSAARADRLARYDELASAVLVARIRISGLMNVHHSNLNPLHVAAQLTGFPLVVSQLERLGQDLCHVAALWRAVRRTAPPPVAEGADELVESMLALCSLVEPAVWKPRRRATHRVQQHAADQRWRRANTRFELVALADAGASREIRKAANADLSSVSTT